MHSLRLNAYEFAAGMMRCAGSARAPRFNRPVEPA
jgi:hypothetical protein